MLDILNSLLHSQFRISIMRNEQFEACTVQNSLVSHFRGGPLVSPPVEPDAACMSMCMQPCTAAAAAATAISMPAAGGLHGTAAAGCVGRQRRRRNEREMLYRHS